MDKGLWFLGLLVLVLVAPFLVLGGLGLLWLRQQGVLWTLGWSTAAILSTTVAYLGFWWWGARFRVPGEKLAPVHTFPPVGLAAWKQVVRLKDEYLAKDVDFLVYDQASACLREVVETVAKHYHPDSDQPLLETPVAQLSRVAELVARDMRELVSEKIPLSHALTLNQLRHLGKMGEFAFRMYQLYRGASFLVSPHTAAMRELQTKMLGETVTEFSKDRLRQWITEVIILRTGYHAIELYSGYLKLGEQPAEATVTTATQEDVVKIEKREAVEQGEPLRILVIGQVKAGKSSLINALFGRVEAAVDVLPTTSRVEPYRIYGAEGLPEALLLDTAGYDDPSQARDFFRDALEEVVKSDLVLLATSAASASRASDKQLLDELHEVFRKRLDQVMPPLLVALTHIDQLRPLREWNPPYNFAEADLPDAPPKLKSIAAAIEAAAEDLQLDPGQIVPVCLALGRVYNVQETLAPYINECLPEARRSRYLRCLKDARDRDYWDRMGRQFRAAGGILGQALRSEGDKALRKLGAWAQKLLEWDAPKPK